MEKKGYNKALAAIIIAAILGGSNVVFAKIALRQIPPFEFTLIRFFIAGLLLLPIIIKNKPSFKKKSFTYAVLLSLLATGNVLLFAFGIKLTTATVAGILYTVGPLLTAIFSFFFLKTAITGKRIFGVMVGFVGVIFITILPVIDKTSAFKGDLVGNLLILLGAILFALYSTFSKSVQKTYTPFQLTFFFVAVTVVTHIPLAYSELSAYPHWWLTLSASSVISLLFVASFGTAVLYVVYQYAIKEGTPLVASLMLYLQPVAAFATAAVVLGERIMPSFALGAVITLFGVWLATY